MVLSFNYHKLPNKKGVDRRTPTIPVILNGNAEISLPVYALVDSGADISVIPKALAEVLDLDLEGKTHESYGIAGEIKVKDSKMKVTISKNHESYSYIIPVQVVLTGEEPPIILGRAGFFNKFIIFIDESKQKIKFKGINKIF